MNHLTHNSEPVTLTESYRGLAYKAWVGDESDGGEFILIAAKASHLAAIAKFIPATPPLDLNKLIPVHVGQ